MDIRNFCIIAHIDHGKSTLADRLLECTGTIAKRDLKEQTLDMLALERDRGITIKLTPVRMHWKGVQLNLIDTPGHTDFRYEVSRSLAACEGAILLVDSSQGIQAQTLAVLSMALENNLAIIPVLNKIDLPAADPDRRAEEVVQLLGCPREDILRISAKEGTNVPSVLDSVLTRIPRPHCSRDVSPVSSAFFTSSESSACSMSSRALIFDAVLDRYRGVIAYVRVVDGVFLTGTQAVLLSTKTTFPVQEVGHFSPAYAADPSLSAGEIGYMITGLKDVKQVRVGDTVAADPAAPSLPGYRRVQPMVYAGLYPVDAEQYPHLRASLEKLSLNDAALSVEPERNVALGNGFRCGFLGLLHLEIVQERLEQEEDCELVVTAPSVLYEVKINVKQPATVVRSSLLKPEEPDTACISNPADFPDASVIAEVREPWVRLEIVCREQDIGAAMTLVQERRGVQQGLAYIEGGRAILTFEIPLQGVILDLFDKLKSATEGYGSLSYDPLGFRAGDLVKLKILLLGESAEALSTIVHRSEAHAIGSIICKRLKEVLPKQQFEIPIQAAMGAKVVARETLGALRKDVTGYLYGGDVSRKKKLLEKQKKGKRRMKKMGQVTLTQEAFLSVLQR